MDLFRNILFAIENEADGLRPFAVKIEGASDAEVGYHCNQIIESGFACGEELTDSSSEYLQWVMLDLTPAGHDFLDAVRADTVWTRTKEKAVTAGGWTLATLRDIAVGIIVESLKKIV